MGKRMKKGKLLFIIFILLIIIGYQYRDDLDGITAWVTSSQVVIASEEDVELYDLALQQNNEILCSQIEFQDFQQDCLVRVAASKKSIEICQIISEKKVKYSCFVGVSKVLNDVEICKNVEDDEYWNDICYKNYAIANNDTNYCFFIAKGIHNNPCYYEIAVNTLNWKICNEVTDNDMLNKCNNLISQQTLKIEPCLQMYNTVDRDACIYRLAKKSNDIKICEEIKLDGIKKDCKDAFGGE